MTATPTSVESRTQRVQQVGQLIAMADLLTPWAVRTASSLGLANAIGAKAASIDEVATATGTDRRAVEKLLRFLARRDIFVESGPGVFELGPLGELLAADLRFPLRMMLDVDGSQSRFGQAAAGLPHAVRTGEAAYPQVFHRSFWDDLAEHPSLGSSFDDLMTVSAARWVPLAVAHGDWSSVHHVVDVGGGAGDLLIGLLGAVPDLHATLVEQPAIAARARLKLAEAGLVDRVDVRVGSFFDPLPPGADLYVLSQVLHDWPDTEAAAILRRCREAVGSSGRVLLIERLVADDQPDVSHADMDLLMLVLFGSSERSPQQFATLADAAGLALKSVVPVGFGVSLLECVPAAPLEPSPARARPRTAISVVPDEAEFRRQVAQRQRRQLEGPVAPPACPDGWQTGPPDYVGVGAQKAGTTWWSLLIAGHPAVATAQPKELHFFQHDWDEEFGDAQVKAYHAYFPRPDGALAGEWTPRYMHDPWTPVRLRRAAPDARLLVLLRDPVARYCSGISHYLARHDQIHPRVISEAIDRGRYATQLSALTEHFPKDQVLVLQLERCSVAPEEEIERTYRFLGLEPSFRPEGLHERVFEGRGPQVNVPSDLRAVLEKTYRTEAAALTDEWPDIDLSLWPSVM